jgi:hypothetical protein
MTNYLAMEFHACASRIMDSRGLKAFFFFVIDLPFECLE